MQIEYLEKLIFFSANLRYALLVTLSFNFYSSVKAQSLAESDYYPTVGKPCPNITIHHIVDASYTDATIDKFHGKWLILDFWNKDCSTCVARFPETSKLQQRYAQQVQFLLIGQQDPADQIRPMFDVFKKRLKLEIPCAFDSVLFRRFDIGSCPHLIIVDPKGIVRGVTTKITGGDLDDLLAGKEPALEKTYFRAHEKESHFVPYNHFKPYLVNGNGGNDSNYIYRFILTKWNPSLPFFVNSEMSIKIKRGIFNLIGISLPQLYNYAFFGKVGWSCDSPEYTVIYPKPDLETKDSALFRYNIAKAENLFCFSLLFPKGNMSVRQVQRLMLLQLNGTFGFAAEIEIRRKPYYALVALNDSTKSRLVAKETKMAITAVPHASFIAKDIPIKRLIKIIYANSYPDPPIINETGITDNIDISMECILTDLEDVKKALRKNGLDLVLKQRDMKVLVIKDDIDH